VDSEKLKLQIEKWKDKIKNQRDKQAKQRLWGVISEYRAKRKRYPFE
jgi:predicted RNase H-like nuclease (RuvC/YqgF family)